jgi:3-oxoadipate enol-lactonase
VSGAAASPGAVRSGWADVPGGRLFYEVAGRGPPLVFVHAGIADRRMWDREFALYAADRTVLRYDSRGFGRSPPATAPYSEHEDLERLLEQLHLLPATVVGSSRGGRIAIDLALEHPPSVSALLLVAPGLSGWTPEMDPEGRSVYELDEARSAEILAAWAAGRRDEALERLRVYWCSETRGPALEALRQMMRENAEEIFTDRSATFDRRPSPGAAERLDRIRAKTRVIYGDRDEPTTGYLVRRVARGIPEARLLPAPGGDHLVNLSRPDIFDSVLRELLR